MDLKSFHAEDISCALCENRRGINSNCCCPEDAKELVLITETKLRRRIGLESHQKLCPAHASKLKNGLLFGGSSVFDCCAPFHVNTTRSPGLRPVPHTWKEYFPSPTHSSVRYRPRQRICWDCYAVALEVINAEQLDSSDDESSSGVKSLPSCLGYVSPRRWASNLSLFPTSPHGSQFGSSWSITSHVSSPKSLTPKGVQCREKEFNDVKIARHRVNAQSPTSPTPSMENKVDDSVESPVFPTEVFTTWSVDTNHNICMVDPSTSQSQCQMHSPKEKPAVRPPSVSTSYTEEVENDSDRKSTSSCEPEPLRRKHDGSDSSVNDEYAEKPEKGDLPSSENDHDSTIDHLLASSPPPSYESLSSHESDEITPLENETNKDRGELRGEGYFVSDETTPGRSAPVNEDIVATMNLAESKVADSHPQPTTPETSSKPKASSQLSADPSHTIDPTSVLGISAENTIDINCVRSGDDSNMEREKEVIDSVAVEACEEEKNDKVTDNQLIKTNSPVLGEQRNSEENYIDSSSDHSFGSDWVLVEARQDEGDLQPCNESPTVYMKSPDNASVENYESNMENIAETDCVIKDGECTNGNLVNEVSGEAIKADDSFRFDPITAAKSLDGSKSNDYDPENLLSNPSSEGTQESANFSDFQSSQPNSVVVDKDETKGHHHGNDEVDFDMPETGKPNHNDMAPSALHYDTDTSSSSGDFGLHPIAEEPRDAIDNFRLETSNNHSRAESNEDFKHNSDHDISCAIANAKAEESCINVPCEANGHASDYTSTNPLREVCMDGDLPPLSYMHERRNVKFDQVIPDNGTSITDRGNDAATPPSNQGELIAATSHSAAKTDLYKHLHGSKDSSTSSSSSDQECESAGYGGHVSNPAPPADSITHESDTSKAESQSTNDPREYHDVQQLRRRAKNNRANSVDVDSSSVNDHRSRPLRPSIRSDGIIANRKNAWKDGKRKFGVSFALPILEGETAAMNQGKRTQNKPLESVSTEIVESRPDAGMLDEGAGLEDESSKRPKILRESRRIHSKERQSTLQQSKDVDEEDKPDQSEDEDVSAILSDIISNVFTTKILTDWTKSFSESPIPMIVFAGVSITAALSLSFIAYLAFR